MSKPVIAVFWGKPVGPIKGRYAYPFSNIGPKYPVYESLFNLLLEKAEVYAAVGYENYIEPMTFSKSFHYLGNGKFEEIRRAIVADAIYDRSAKMIFPGDSTTEDLKVTNSNMFKTFSNNKWDFYQQFPQYCPRTYFVENESELPILLSTLNKADRYVVKPFNGYKGKGIKFGTPKELYDYTFEKQVPLIVQKFMETEEGIPGIAEGRHDFRVVVINEKIVWATIREPNGNGLLANVAQGGSIREISIDSIPKSAATISLEIGAYFKKHYNNPLFSIDFGFSKGKPFIYEINDQIGFPRPEMLDNSLVVSLTNLLIEKASL